MSEDFDYICKLVIMGDRDVGKCALTHRFAGNNIPLPIPRYDGSLCIDFAVAITTVDDARIKLRIWNTSDQEAFYPRSGRSLYRGTDGLFIVYDICSMASFDYAKSLFPDISLYASPSAKKILIGNKCDKTHERVVKYEVAEEFARSQGIPLVETSAKDMTNVNFALLNVLKGIGGDRGWFYGAAATCLFGSGGSRPGGIKLPLSTCAVPPRPKQQSGGCIM